MNSGCSGSRWAVSNRSALDARSSSHRTSRPGSHGASVRPRRSTTITWRTDRRRVHRLVRRLLHRDDLAAPREAVGRDQDRRLRVLEPLRDRVGAEPARTAAATPPRASNTPSPPRPPPASAAGRSRPRRATARPARRGRSRAGPRPRAARGTRRAGWCPPRPPTRSRRRRGCVRPIGRRSCARGSPTRRRTTSPTRPRGRCRGSRYRARRTRGRGRGSTASQNHSTSEVERSISSSSVAMPWARINRVTFARSTTSGEGLHTIVTACPASFPGLRVRSAARERRRSRTQPMTPTT